MFTKKVSNRKEKGFKMTNKQRWLIEKLMKEIEKLSGYVFTGRETYYGSNGYDFYSTTKKEASADIEMLLNIKNDVLNGSSFEEAYEKELGK